MNPVTIVGHARLSPYLVRSPNKDPEALFTVATVYRTLTGIDEVQERITETRVVAYGDLAEHAAASINKGTHVIVTGLKEGTGVLVATEIGLALSLTPQGGGS